MGLKLRSMTSDATCYPKERSATSGLKLALVSWKWHDTVKMTKVLNDLHLVEKEGDQDWSKYTRVFLDNAEKHPLVRQIRISCVNLSPARQRNTIQILSVVNNIRGIEICNYSTDPNTYILGLTSPLIAYIIENSHCHAETLQYLILALNMDIHAVPSFFKTIPLYHNLTSFGFKLSPCQLESTTVDDEPEYPRLHNCLPSFIRSMSIDLPDNISCRLLEYINLTWYMSDLKHLIF